MSSKAMLPADHMSAAARLLTVCAVVLLAAQPAQAQEDQQDQEGAEPLQEVIVTGTAAGAEIQKLEASFAITTLSDVAITQYSPQSTADLLKLVPGVWSESSGGVSGANVMVRGFPGGGDAPYLTVQVNGAPLYPISTLAFLENTTMFRIDETVRRVEALRGGPNPVFSNGQPGLTTNFILREGGEETEGIAKYTTSDYDLRRFDGRVSGPLGKGFYYMIGGYVTSSPGLRDAGYNSDEGPAVHDQPHPRARQRRDQPLPPADRRLRPVVPAGGAERAGRGRLIQPARRHEPAAPDHHRKRRPGISQWR
ncbi:MAG: TonB-dependent receptor plug domain-containing protein [Gammaproteobacteria bacterium]